jgi:hypothetical protein
MDMGRTFMNVLGNCLASVVMAKSEGAFRVPGWEEALASRHGVEGEELEQIDYAGVSDIASPVVQKPQMTDDFPIQHDSKNFSTLRGGVKFADDNVVILAIDESKKESL